MKTRPRSPGWSAVCASFPTIFNAPVGCPGNRVIIASQHALTAALTPRILRVLQSRNGELYVRLRSANLDDCYSLLLSRQADLAFLYDLPDNRLGQTADFIRSMRIGDDRLIPVFSAADKDRLNARYAKGELPVIAYPNDVFLGQVMDRTILPRVRSQVDVIPRVETALTLAAQEFAAAGIGRCLGATLACLQRCQGRQASGSVDHLADRPTQHHGRRSEGAHH